MKLYKMYMLLGLLACFIKLNAQQISVKEKNNIITAVIKAGCNLEQCDSADSYCNSMNKLSRRAFAELKNQSIGIVETYSAKLIKPITNYEFTNSFNSYFKLDTTFFKVDFYKLEGMRRVIFGSSNRINNKLEFTQVMPISSEVDVLLNGAADYDKFVLIFPTFRGFPLFVKENRIYAIRDSQIVDGRTFFESYSIEEINIGLKFVDKKGRR